MKKFKIKKSFLVAGIILILIGAIFFIRFFIGEEDSWIKDSRGVWVKHGNPAETPNYVLKQQKVISCAGYTFAQLRPNFTNFSSQCLGACDNYSIDLVHVPRTAEDDKTENQCKEYLNGETSNFIELDNKGNIVRIS
ncbi:Uncharacterised protein [uncultured archaeon]|nr:Uncharacterised protein [uncultured archaeon]